jgi:hypothetical protein
VGTGLASWARLVKVTLVRSVSMKSATKANRITPHLLVVIASGLWLRRGRGHEPAESPSQTAIMGIIPRGRD